MQCSTPHRESSHQRLPNLFSLQTSFLAVSLNWAASWLQLQNGVVLCIVMLWWPSKDESKQHSYGVNGILQICDPLKSLVLEGARKDKGPVVSWSCEVDDEIYGKRYMWKFLWNQWGMTPLETKIIRVIILCPWLNITGGKALLRYWLCREGVSSRTCMGIVDA